MEAEEYIVADVGAAQTSIVLLKDDQTTSLSPATTINLAAVDGKRLILTGSTDENALHDFVADTQGGTGLYDGLEFILENRTGGYIASFAYSADGSTSTALDGGGFIFPGQTALVSYVEDGAATAQIAETVTPFAFQVKEFANPHLSTLVETDDIADNAITPKPVSYTHLTLPTILLV